MSAREEALRVVKLLEDNVFDITISGNADGKKIDKTRRAFTQNPAGAGRILHYVEAPYIGNMPFTEVQDMLQELYHDVASDNLREDIARFHEASGGKEAPWGITHIESALKAGPDAKTYTVVASARNPGELDGVLTAMRRQLEHEIEEHRKRQRRGK